MKYNKSSLKSQFFIGFMLFSLPFFAIGIATPTLTVSPITWNVVGLDSNRVTDGPNTFPVGVNVCNTSGSTQTNLTATFKWDSTNSNINLRPGTLSQSSIASLANSACQDVYFEIEVTRTAAAYDTARRYHIELSSPTIVTPISSPTPREIYVEHLVSQNRNTVQDIKLNGTSIASGATMTLTVGQTYTIDLYGNTSTSYDQIESFINFPNTIFKVNSVTSTYGTISGSASGSINTLYNNACNWDSDPTHAARVYRSCLGTGSAGGAVVNHYNITVIGGAGTTNTLNTLIYDFSGSSYHYNSDFSTTPRIAVVNPANGVTDLGITKTISNSNPNPGDPVTFTLTATNYGTDAATGVTVSDLLPSGYTLTSTSTTSGSYTAPTWTIGNLANGASATLTINATVNSSGSYANTATISGNETDNNSANNSSTATPTVVVPNSADVSIQKTVNPTTATPGTNVTFSLTASNSPTSAAIATGVEVTDILPSGYTYVSSTPSGATTYNSGNGVWTIGNINIGASATLTIVATVNNTGPYLNSATINATSPDPNPDNNAASVSPAITNSPVSQIINLQASLQTINVGQNSILTSSGYSGVGAITYTLVSGPCTLQGTLLIGTGIGNCVVRSTIAADQTYQTAISNDVIVAVTALPSTANAIPTLSEWAQIILMLIISYLAIGYRKDILK